MSLPPGFLDELRTRLSLAQVVGRKVNWDTRKSNQAKGDLWAPCPFHQEKTASFHVDDRKGFYYCFGCHAKGDAIGFVRDSENVSFMEAVEILAREAGLPMPARDPKAQEKADRRSQLTDVMAQAVQFFRLQLKTGAGSAARDYLARRGLSEAAQDRWGIGFAPDSWEALRQHLTEKGVAIQMLLDAGLVRASDRGREPYDTFRNRIMFPIHDQRGRAIAFGGRAMDANDTAKYLNSPETEIFDKGRTLFNLARAREAAGKDQPLIVAEGYMDVIALSEAGFPAAVAPLGTAVTEDQLRLLWRVASEPIFALDGDQAGLRAAMRTMDLALPMLEAGRSLRFALLPEGLDPDDLIRVQGRAAMQKVFDTAMPMVRLLWQQHTAGQNFDSPERKATLDKVLRDKIATIRDGSIRGHYGQAIKELRWQLFSERPRTGTGPRTGGKARPPASSLPQTKATPLAQGDGFDEQIHEAVILATVIVTPMVFDAVQATLELLECRDRDHAAMRAAILTTGGGEGLRARVENAVGADRVERLLTQRTVALSAGVRHPGDTEAAARTIGEQVAKLSARRGHARELAEALEDMGSEVDEGLTWRLAQAAEALHSAGQIRSGDQDDFEAAPNGAEVSREERSAFDALIQKIDYSKGKTSKSRH